MASYGVRENIILTITPNFDGVCGMLLYIILDFVMLPNWMLNHNFECFKPTYWMFLVTDVFVTI